MANFIDRLNLYDILAMVIPGSIVLMGIGMFELIYDYAQNWVFIEHYGESGHAFWTTTAIILFFVVAYLLGIIIQVLNVYIWCWAKYLTNFYVNQHIKKTITEGRKTLNDFVEAVKGKNDKLSAYYEAYNYAIVFHPQTAVLTIEKQIAMLRNMTIAIMPMCIAIFPFTWYWNIVCWFGIVILLFGIIIARMQKVVELVFEEYEAVKQLKLDTLTDHT